VKVKGFGSGMTKREEEISKLYVATLNRMPDEEGLDYWINDSGLTVSQIAKSFFEQPETEALYPPGYSTDDFVDAVYANLFNREADINGKEYWVSELESGNIERNQFILAVIHGAQGNDAKILEYKINIPKKPIEKHLSMESEISNIDSEGEESYYLTSYNSTTAEDGYLWKYTDKISYVSRVETGLREGFMDETPESAKALIYGEKWNKTVISYTFNTEIPSEYYSYSAKYANNWQPFSEHEKELVRGIFDKIEAFANLRFIEVEEKGDIRFNHADMEGGIEGFARYPYPNSFGGDIWISNDIPTEGDEPGSGRYYTLLHEIGHALGLKHPFTGSPVLSYYQDDSNHTVMSYTHRGDEVLERNHDKSDTLHGYAYYLNALPDNYTVYDIGALQALYGVNWNYDNSGDDIYNLSDLYLIHGHYTIWDTGGRDTLNLSLTKYPDHIDMRDGRFSSVDVHSLEVQKEDAVNYFIRKGYMESSALQWGEDVFVNADNIERLYTGDNTLGIAYGTVLENVITGSANDVVIDNDYDNIIITGDGNDKIFMHGEGFDQIDGGEGIDKIYLDFPDYEARLEELPDGRWVIDATYSHHSLIIVNNVELIAFDNSEIEL